MTPLGARPATDIPPAAGNAGVEPVRLRHRILRAGGWAGAGFVVDKLIAAIQLTMVARILTPADFGVMAASAAVLLAMITISELGLDQALIAKGDVNEGDLTAVWTLSLGRGVLMAACVWASADIIGRIMQMPLLASVLRIHAWVLVFHGLHSPAMALLLKNLDLRRRVSTELIRRVIEAGATITLSLWFRNVWGLLAGQLIGSAVGSLLSFWVAPFRPRISLREPAVTYFLHYGKRLNITTLCMFGVMTGGELVIGRVLGQDALGIYQIALAIPLLIGVRATALIHQISMPTFAMLQRDRAGVLRVFELQMGLVGLVFIPLATGVAVFAPVIVPLAFGDQWIEAVTPLRILCLYAICAGYAGVMTAVQYGANRPDLQMKSWAGQFVLYAAVILPCTIHWGIAGAAAALAVSYVLGVFLQGIGTRVLVGGSVDATLWSSGRASVLAGSLAGILVLLAGTDEVPVTSGLMMAVWIIGIGTYGWYLWWVEVPRWKVLWDHR
jgi:O-antigen/teichoic acid export membrane protein